jgi:Zn-dependent peptidase ImmA (M78 family)
MAVRLELPPNRLPMMPENPVTAAQVTRTAFGASPDVRLPNLTHLMEKNGVFVLAIPFAVEKIDAFSFWTDIDGERPIVTFLDDKPGDRLRWTAAHELGHLVMHRQIKGRLQSVEREADEFAEELLMPEALARQLIVPPVTLVTVARLKSSFGASMAAIIRRAHNLGIISDRRYRYLFEQLSKNGWRKREPANLDIPVEKPRMFRKMLNMHYGRTVTLDRYSLEMGLAKERAVAIINAHSKEEERIFEDESVVLFASS